MAASYRAVFERLTDGRPPSVDYGLPITAAPEPIETRSRWRPRLAKLDLAVDPVLPRALDAVTAVGPPDRLAERVGSEVSPVLQDAQVVTLAGIRVVDNSGTVVATTGTELGLSLGQREEVRRALTGEFVSLLRQRVSGQSSSSPSSASRGSNIRVFAAVPILRHERIIGAVVLSRTPADIRQILYAKRGQLATGGLVLLLAAALIAVLTSLTINRPIRALMAQAQRAARGEQQAMTPLVHPGTHEIAELSRTLADMSRTLEQRASYIRDFASQVSHGFKTPLTAVRGAVELLRDHADTISDEERNRFLENLDHDARRLEKLVNRLLELSRAEAMQPGDETTDLAAVFDSVNERWQDSTLKLIVDEPPSGQVAMSAATLESVLTNLLENALLHAGGPVTVLVTCAQPASHDQSLSVVVTDDGPGISAANQERVFEPFFTTAQDRGGTGLGLAVVRALLRAHGGDIRLLESNQGSAFELRLPVR